MQGKKLSPLYLEKKRVCSAGILGLGGGGKKKKKNECCNPGKKERPMQPASGLPLIAVYNPNRR